MSPGVRQGPFGSNRLSSSASRPAGPPPAVEAVTARKVQRARQQIDAVTTPLAHKTVVTRLSDGSTMYTFAAGEHAAPDALRVDTPRSRDEEPHGRLAGNPAAPQPCDAEMSSNTGPAEAVRNGNGSARAEEGPSVPLRHSAAEESSDAEASTSGWSFLDEIPATKVAYGVTPPPFSAQVLPTNTGRKAQAHIASSSSTVPSAHAKPQHSDVVLQKPRKKDAAARVIRNQTPGEVMQTFTSMVAGHRLDDVVSFMQEAKGAGHGELCKLVPQKAYMQAAGADVDAAMQFLHAVPTEYATASTYMHALRVARRASSVPAARAMLDLIRARNGAPDALHYSLAIALHADAGDVDGAFALLGEMLKDGVKPDLHVIATLMSAITTEVQRLRGLVKVGEGVSGTSTRGPESARRQRLVLVDRAFNLLKLADSHRLRPDAAVWNALIAATGASGQLTRAFRLLDDMAAGGVRPVPATFVAVMDACVKEQERALALRVYSAARRNGAASLQVHTLAVAATMLPARTGGASTSSDFGSALTIYQNVQAEGLTPDAHFMNVMIAAAGQCGGALRVYQILDDVRDAELDVTPAMATTVVRAFLAAGDLREAQAVYRQFMEKDKIVPTIEGFNALVNAHGAQGSLTDAVAILEDLVASRLRPNGATVASLVCACQRVRAHELAFEVARAARVRGVKFDAVIGAALIRTAYNKIRHVWIPTGYPPPLDDAEADCRERSLPDAATAERMLHALTGRGSQEVGGDGPAKPAVWRDRAHAVYSELIEHDVDISLRVLERLLGCMLLHRGRNGRPERVRVGRRVDTGTFVRGGTRHAGSAASHLDAVASLDGRFDPRAYRYIEDAVYADKLPNMTVVQDRTIDLRSVPPLVAEAYVLELFHQLFNSAGPMRKLTPMVLTFLGTPFDRTLINVPSTDKARVATTRAERAKARAAAELAAAGPESVSLSSMSADEFEELDDLSQDYMSLQGDTASKRDRATVRKLERMYGCDLSMFGSGAATAAANVLCSSSTKYTGMAIASALRSLRVRYVVEGSVGVVIVEPEEIAAWLQRRNVALLDTSQARRLRHSKRRGGRRTSMGSGNESGNESSDEEALPRDYASFADSHGAGLRRELAGQEGASSADEGVLGSPYLRAGSDGRPAVIATRAWGPLGGRLQFQTAEMMRSTFVEPSEKSSFVEPSE